MGSLQQVPLSGLAASRGVWETTVGGFFNKKSAFFMRDQMGCGVPWGPPRVPGVRKVRGCFANEACYYSTLKHALTLLFDIVAFLGTGEGSPWPYKDSGARTLAPVREGKGRLARTDVWKSQSIASEITGVTTVAGFRSPPLFSVFRGISCTLLS